MLKYRIVTEMDGFGLIIYVVQKESNAEGRWDRLFNLKDFSNKEDAILSVRNIMEYERKIHEFKSKVVWTSDEA